MKHFCALYDGIDASTRINAKVAAMRDYFRTRPADDCAWAVYVLAGGTPKRVVPTARLRALACTEAGVADWLFEESYAMVGDLAETIAHLLPTTRSDDTRTLTQWMTERILPLRVLDGATQLTRVREDWQALDTVGRFIYVKLIGGGLRVGVAKGLVIRALAEAFELDSKRVSERMMGFTRINHAPRAEDFLALTAPLRSGDAPDRGGSSYPFFLAHPLQAEPTTLGALRDWQLEWKYDGIRVQAVRRAGKSMLWSRGEELINEAFPDVVAMLDMLAEGTVLDGELVVWRDDAPAPFADLQKRLGRKSIGKATLSKLPTALIAYDCLEHAARDLRAAPLCARRAQLELIVAQAQHPMLRLSPVLHAHDWSEALQRRAHARSMRTEGLMLKRLDSAYGVGRTGNDWWKWKVEPYTVDAVMTYAQRGHGRRAGLYTDYTFGVWTRAPRDASEAMQALALTPTEAAARDLPTLVTFAKAYSGLTDAEIKEVDRVIRTTGLEDFGPVRALKPTLVMELGFEGIAQSARHKSGVAVRFPRILRLRPDKPLHEADTIASLRALIGQHAA